MTDAPLGVGIPHLGTYSRVPPSLSNPEPDYFNDPNPTYYNDANPSDLKTWDELKVLLPATHLTLEQQMAFYMGDIH